MANPKKPAMTIAATEFISKNARLTPAADRAANAGTAISGAQQTAQAAMIMPDDFSTFFIS